MRTRLGIALRVNPEPETPTPKQVYMLIYPRVSMSDSVLFEGNLAALDGGAVRTISISDI